MQTEKALRRLGWTIQEPSGIGGQELILLAESTRYGSRFRLIVNLLPSLEPLLLYRRHTKRITRPEPMAGIIPLDFFSCNLPFHTLAFISTSERVTFQYAEEVLGIDSGRDRLPAILPAVRHLRRRFLHEYMTALATKEANDDLFFLNLLVTDNALSMLHPRETEEALAGDNPFAMGWEAGFVPLHLPPPRLQPEQVDNQEEDRVEGLTAGAASTFQNRFHFLLRQLPAIYWLISTQALEESLRFILSYSPRWQAEKRETQRDTKQANLID